jgi:glutathione S-transferase
MSQLEHVGRWFLSAFLLAASAPLACVGNIADGLEQSSVPAGERFKGDKSGGDSVAPNTPSVPVDIASGPAKAYKPLQPLPASLSRLTVEQYHNTIADIFGPEVKPASELEENERTELFLSIGASKVGTSSTGVEQYEAAAKSIAGQVMQRRASYPWLASCTPDRADDPCISKAIETIGLSLWRRPLTAEEVQRYVELVGAAGPGKDKLEVGLRYALATLMQSPYFLHVVPVGEPDPAAAGLRRYTGYELASRLSYLIWNSTPDPELLDAAGAGKLTSKAGVEAEVNRMLGKTRARSVASRFLAELWDVVELELDQKDTTVYPTWSPALLDAYRREFETFVEDLVFDRDGDIRELFDGRNTFGDTTLAKAYGMTGGTSSFSKLPLPAGRFGLLTSGAVMAANAKPDRTSPTLRGVFVLERILCKEVPPPPADVDDVLPADQNLPVRERLAQHRTNPACAGCHSLFDPIGLTFENFDGIGLFRTTDAGKTIDASGDFEGRSLSNMGEVASFLRNHPRVGPCVAEKFYTFAAGHEVDHGEEGVVEALGDALAAANHRFRKLLVETASSTAFRTFASPR